MARETIEIGPCPCMEDCAQVGDSDYRERATRECRAFIAQLRRIFGPEPEGARLRVKWNPHDFGSYAEVAVTFATDSESCWLYAGRLESEAPERWDGPALVELGRAAGV